MCPDPSQKSLACQRSNRGPFLALLVAVCGCGEAAATPPVAPVPTATAPTATGVPSSVVALPVAAPKVDPWALPDGPRDDDPISPPPPALRLDDWEKGIKARGVPAPPVSCTQVKKPAAGATPEEIARHADLAPIECADGITDPFLKTRAGSAGDLAHVLVGLSLASKLARTASTPPTMGAIREKEKVKAFIAGPLKTWVVEQATAIETLASGAAGLAGYGRGIAAIEAGIAEMRLVDKLRSAPVPAGWDPELKSVYEAALDEALEPRKRRGRDAALVGMSDFAQVGVLYDARIDRARALLAKLYGGRRIDALDALMVPPREVAPAGTASVFWVTALEKRFDDTVLARGVPQRMRARFRAGAAPPPSQPLLSAYARARLDLGRLYWRRIDFVETAYAAKTSTAPEDRLVLALALALAHAPNGAVAMMSAPAPSALDLAHTEALDALVAEPSDKTSPIAGMAAFDAAHLRSLSPPDGDAAPAYLRDVAVRFKKAEALLTDPAQKKKAAERAAEADAIATAAEKRKP